ncbi:MAG: hypothetical protein KIT57_03605 [Blastocatellales bacterium]|nr:hypothetical protein [Blastocatellales bacterium]
MNHDAQNRITDFPAAIEATAIAHHTAGKTLEFRRELVALRAAEIKVDILIARNDAGKPLYSNETARECATVEALASDEQYQQLIEEANQAERLKTELAAKLERLRAQYRIALIDYEADRLGRRAA